MRLPLRDASRHVYRFHELALEEEAVVLAGTSPHEDSLHRLADLLLDEDRISGPRPAQNAYNVTSIHRLSPRILLGVPHSAGMLFIQLLIFAGRRLIAKKQEGPSVHVDQVAGRKRAPAIGSYRMADPSRPLSCFSRIARKGYHSPYEKKKGQRTLSLASKVLVGWTGFEPATP